MTAASDQGFTLVEVVVAMGITLFVIMGLLGASVSAVRASASARIDQQAGDVINSALEDIRSLQFSAIAMDPADVASDPTISGNPQSWSVPNGIGSEQIVVATGGAVAPHITTVSTDQGVTYEVSRYITAVADNPSVKRVTVVAEWTWGDVTRTRVSSTVVANSRRGLPVPNFTIVWRPGGITSINPGNRAVLPFLINNMGPRDTFALRPFINAAADGDVALYVDEGCVGSFDPDSPPQPVPMSSGLFTTQELLSDSTSCFLAVRTFPAAGTYNVEITGVSVNQPAVVGSSATTGPQPVLVCDAVACPTPSPTATPTPTPTSTTATPTPTPTPTSTTPTPTATPSCPQPSPTPTSPRGFTLHRYLLQNRPVGDTGTQDINPMGVDDCSVQSRDNNFSSPSPGIGRLIERGGKLEKDNDAKVAEWHWLATSFMEASGPIQFTFWYQCASGTSKVKVGVGTWDQTKKNDDSGWHTEADEEETLTCDGTFRQATFNLSAKDFRLYTNKGTKAEEISLGIRMVVEEGSAIRINYDSPNAPSALYINTQPVTP